MNDTDNSDRMDQRRREAFLQLNACVNYMKTRDDKDEFPDKFEGSLVKACAVLYDGFDEDLPDVDTESWEEIK